MQRIQGNSKMETVVVIFHGPTLFSIQTHEKHKRKRKEKIRTGWNWVSIVKTINFSFITHLSNEFKGIQ